MSEEIGYWEQRLKELVGWRADVRLAHTKRIATALDELAAALSNALPEDLQGDVRVAAETALNDVKVKATNLSSNLTKVNDTIETTNTSRAAQAQNAVTQLDSFPPRMEPWQEGIVRGAVTGVTITFGPLSFIASELTADAINDYMARAREAEAQKLVKQISDELDKVRFDLNEKEQAGRDDRGGQDGGENGGDDSSYDRFPDSGVNPLNPDGGGNPPAPNTEPPGGYDPPNFDPPFDPPYEPPFRPPVVFDPPIVDPPVVDPPFEPPLEPPIVYEPPVFDPDYPTYPDDGTDPFYTPDDPGTGTPHWPAPGGSGGPGGPGGFGGGGVPGPGGSGGLGGAGSAALMGGAGGGTALAGAKLMAGTKTGAGLAGGLGGLGGSRGGFGSGSLGATGTAGAAGAAGGRPGAMGMMGGAGGAGGGAGSGSGSSGGRRGMGMMGGAGGAGGGADEKKRRQGMSGLVAPSLDDDEEIGARSRAAEAGGRSSSDE